MSDESQDCYEHVVSHSIRTMKNLLIVDKSILSTKHLNNLKKTQVEDKLYYDKGSHWWKCHIFLKYKCIYFFRK